MNTYTKCTYHSEEWRNSCQTMAQASSTNTGKNLAKALAFTHIQSSPRNPREKQSHRKYAQFPERNNEKDQTW